MSALSVDPAFINDVVSIGNETRKIILYSDTHPDANHSDHDTYETTRQIVDAMRSQRYASNPYKSDASLFLNDHIDFHAHFAKEWRVGNCYEYAQLAHSLCREEHFNLTPHLVINPYNDHIVAVFAEGDLTLSKKEERSHLDNDYRRRALVLDAWMGYIYLLSQYLIDGCAFQEIPDRNCYRALNCVTSINPLSPHKTTICAHRFHSKPTSRLSSAEDEISAIPPSLRFLYEIRRIHVGLGVKPRPKRLDPLSQSALFAMGEGLR